MWGGICFCGRAFFYADVQFSPRSLDDLPGILLGELLVFAVALDGLLDGRDFVLGNIAAAVLVVLPGIEIEVRPGWPLADRAQAAVLHVLNLEDLLKQGLGSKRCVHEVSIDVHLYIAIKKGAKSPRRRFLSCAHVAMSCHLPVDIPVAFVSRLKCQSLPVRRN